MRRTVLAVAASVAVLGAATATGVSLAGTAAGVSLASMTAVNVCPAVAAPKATCFAKLRVDAATGVAPFAATPNGFGPADLTSAYAVPSGAGSGRTVAIVDAYGDPSVESDLATYRSTFGLPACTIASGCLTVVNQDGATSPLPTGDQGWGGETSLDLDMVSAICPSCKILLVQATNNGIDALAAAVNTAARLGATTISNSYGSPEFAAETQFDASYHHPGQPVVVSAGDNGYGVNFPAASEYVTAVGGTTLTRTGSAWNETVWAGTGSGCSAYIAKPSWQTDANCPMRMLNDVSAVADPATGVAVYDTYGQSGWLVFGGTSVSAPIIAALYAMTSSVSGIAGGEMPWQHHTGSAFRDVTSGTNVPGTSAATCGGDYLCTGVVGYDGPTGWGTPQGLSGL